MSDTNSIIGRLGALFVQSLHIEGPSADTDLFETRILDSLQLVELLLQLEQRFGFRIKIEDIDLEDLRTLARIARLVAARTGAGTQTAQVHSLEVRHDAASQEGNHPGLRPRGTEPWTGEPQLSSRSVR